MSDGRDITEAFWAPVDDALDAKRRAETPRDYLGASAVGAECERRAAYDWHLRGDPRFAPEARALRIFDMGHMIEAMKERWINGAYELVSENQDGSQMGFALFDGRFKGHCDGVLAGFRLPGSAPVDMPALWECKGLGSKGWSKLRKEGLRRAYPTYYGQVQLYMAHIAWRGRPLTQHPAIFTALCKDDSQPYVERVPFDPATAARLTARAESLLESESPEEFRRLSEDGRDFRCKMCPYMSVCHGADDAMDGPPNGGAPAWL